MFIAIYRFSVKTGHEHAFRLAWLELTQGIYLQRGSLGSRLHREVGGKFIGYAQWPSRAAWKTPVIFSWMNATGKPGSECGRPCWRMKHYLKWQ